MTIKTTLIADILLLEPKVYYDERGYFMESFNEREFEALQKVKFVQDNESMSKKVFSEVFIFKGRRMHRQNWCG